VRIVLASHNTAKLTQLQELFAPLGAQLMLLPQLSAVVPEETGATFVENALLKARHAAALYRHCGARRRLRHLCRCTCGRARGAFRTFRRCRRKRCRQQQAAAATHAWYRSGTARRGVPLRAGVSAQRCRPGGPSSQRVSGAGVVLDAPRGDGGFATTRCSMCRAGATAAELAVRIRNAISHRGLAAHAMAQLLRHEFAAQHLDMRSQTAADAGGSP